MIAIFLFFPILVVRICRSWEFEIESGQYKICEFLVVLQELRENRNFLTLKLRHSSTTTEEEQGRQTVNQCQNVCEYIMCVKHDAWGMAKCYLIRKERRRVFSSVVFHTHLSHIQCDFRCIAIKCSRFPVNAHNTTLAHTFLLSAWS